MYASFKTGEPLERHSNATQHYTTYICTLYMTDVHSKGVIFLNMRECEPTRFNIILCLFTCGENTCTCMYMYTCREFIYMNIANIHCICDRFISAFFLHFTHSHFVFRTCNNKSRCSTRKWRRRSGVRSSSILTKSLQSTPSSPSLLPVPSLR